MILYFHTFLSYFIEFISFSFVAYKAMDRKIRPSFLFVTGGFLLSSLFTLSEITIENPLLLYLMQIGIYLLLYVHLFQTNLKPIIYLYVLVFTVNCLIQLVSVLPVVICPSLLKYSYTETAALLFNLLISFLIYQWIPVNRLFHSTYNSKLTTQLLCTNLYLLVICIMLFSKWNTKSFIELFFIILLCVFSVLAINIDMFHTNVKLQKVEAELQAYQTYLPIVEGLISDVRMKQHNFENTIQSFAALPLTCNDYKSIVNALEAYSKDAFEKNLPSNLLKLNCKLIAGFLHTKDKEAIKQQKYLHITIKNYVLQTVIPEYILMQCLGILIDNALEAVSEGTIVPLLIDSKNAQVWIEISNPSPYISDALLNQMFQVGYTTKSNAKEHGLGLPFLSEHVKKYNGSLLCQNQKKNGENYITFKLHI